MDTSHMNTTGRRERTAAAVVVPDFDDHFRRRVAERQDAANAREPLRIQTIFHGFCPADDLAPEPYRRVRVARPQAAVRVP